MVAALVLVEQFDQIVHVDAAIGVDVQLLEQLCVALLVVTGIGGIFDANCFHHARFFDTCTDDNDMPA